MTKENQFKEELKILLEKFNVEIFVDAENNSINFFACPEWEMEKP